MNYLPILNPDLLGWIILIKNPRNGSANKNVCKQTIINTLKRNTHNQFLREYYLLSR